MIFQLSSLSWRSKKVTMLEGVSVFHLMVLRSLRMSLNLDHWFSCVGESTQMANTSSICIFCSKGGCVENLEGE